MFHKKLELADALLCAKWAKTSSPEADWYKQDISACVSIEAALGKQGG
jgi:hypothetical protein